MGAMRRGEVRVAHAISDAVLANRNPSERDDPRLPYHLRWVWDGRELTGRHVLVRCYHGLGDTIQFARFLPILRCEAASVTVEVQPELFGLLATMRGPDRLIPFRPEAPAKPAERDVEIMELAHALRVDARAVAVPYLAVPSARLPTRGGLNIGLCWRGGDWDSERSVPSESLRQACDVPRVCAWSLQYRTVDAIEPIPLRCAVPAGADVMTMASAIARLDLVITVDTMIAHLAGALGRETWLLLRQDSDWRWMEGRSDSPWYPSMRLYRQSRAGDWSEPLARIAADLRVRAAAAAS